MIDDNVGSAEVGVRNEGGIEQRRREDTKGNDRAVGFGGLRKDMTLLMFSIFGNQGIAKLGNFS